MFFKKNYIYNLNKNKNTIIFDFDGTIADTFEHLLDVFDQYFGDFGVEIADQKVINKLKGMSAKDIFSYLKIPKILIPFFVMQINNSMKKRINEIYPFEEVIIQIKKLKSNYNVGLLSTNTKENLNIFLKNHKISYLFDFVESEKDLFKKHKTLLKIINDNKLDCNKLLYIGDEVRDIETCKIVNIPILSVAWGFNNFDILSKNNKFVIQNANELETMINLILKKI